MGRKNYWFIIVIIFAVLSIFICINIPFQLGLDLRGGSQLTLEVQPTEEIKKITSNEMDGVNKVLNAAALTYVAAAIQAIGQLAYYVFMLMGNSDD